MLIRPAAISDLRRRARQLFDELTTAALGIGSDLPLTPAESAYIGAYTDAEKKNGLQEKLL